MQRRYRAVAWPLRYLEMKKLIALFIFLVFADTQGVELPAGTVTVKAYLFDCTLGTADPKSGTPLLDKEFNLSKGIIGKPVKLNDEQIKNFLIAFDKGSAFSAAAGCHVPHHGLFFLIKKVKPLVITKFVLDVVTLGRQSNI